MGLEKQFWPLFGWPLKTGFTVLQLFSCLQRIRSIVDEREQRQMLMELDAVMRSNDCPYIVQFYGALFKEVQKFFI